MEQQACPTRGKLRVYLGAAPGVGKTYAMLAEGHRRRDRGTDVVVGYVETHGRARTQAALGDLEVVPRAVVPHQGGTGEEMDLAAILARRPAVVLIDELAHTNLSPGGPPTQPDDPARPEDLADVSTPDSPPSTGGRHAKRWQDVETLLAAGIEVITTVNIQHLESLNDVTAQVTGVRQRETVPDAVVRAADQIELVDMSPEALRRRLAHGNVYAQDRIDAALSNYFREGNLAALRELALLWLADRVEENLERYRDDHDIRGTWATRARIVVPISGGPESPTLMRRAARIAARRSGGEWMALYVARPDGLSGVSPDQLADLRTRAESLGGTFHTVLGDDVAATVLDFTRAENASQVVVGMSRRGRLSTVLRPGVGERVVALAGEVDVLLVTHDFVRRSERSRPSTALSARRRLVGFALAVLAPIGVSALLRVFGDFTGLPTEAMTLMAVVVATALVGGLAPAVVSALLSGLLLNWYFTPPLNTLTIAEPSNMVAIALFVLVGIAVASVVDHSARRAVEARRARAEADALTALSHSLLTSADDLTGLLDSACELFGARGAAVRGRDAAHTPVASTGDTSGEAGVSASIDDQSELVLFGGTHVSSERRLLRAYAAYATVIAERQRARAADLERGQLAAADRTRTALLAAVSHDLRSPLAAVQASVSTLRHPTLRLSPQDREDLLENIDVSAERLAALVTNLLDMSRINAGAVRPHLRVLDLAQAALEAAAPLEGGERIEVEAPTGPDGVLAWADEGLLERVLANLFENALKYTPAHASIRVSAAASGDRVVLRVADTGPGVAPGDREKLFAPFQRLDDVPTKGGITDGVGLGLAVARGLTEAMGGTLGIEDTPGGGLTFLLDLAGPPPVSPTDRTDPTPEGLV